jgi:hypothetical protein
MAPLTGSPSIHHRWGYVKSALTHVDTIPSRPAAASRQVSRTPAKVQAPPPDPGPTATRPQHPDQVIAPLLTALSAHPPRATGRGLRGRAGRLCRGESPFRHSPLPWTHTRVRGAPRAVSDRRSSGRTLTPTVRRISAEFVDIQLRIVAPQFVEDQHSEHALRSLPSDPFGGLASGAFDCRGAGAVSYRPTGREVQGAPTPDRRCHSTAWAIVT